MSSKTQLCNLALTQLGAGTIISLDDGTENADSCRTLFDDISDEVISLGPWTSCVFRADLAPLATTPTYGYDVEYQLPTNPYCLRLLDVYVDDRNSYVVEGRKILTDSSSLKIRYIGRPSDTEDYDQMLKRAIVARLKSCLAYKITGQSSVADRCNQEYMTALKEGLAVDGKQGTSEFMRSLGLLEIR